jgi:tRNA1Val (adenine37-N6)-methyltransferase
LSEDYLQPEDGYRFSRDSILLARFTPKEQFGRAADLGAGCGVVGLEALAQGHLVGLSTLYLVEANDIFSTSLEENIRRAKKAQMEENDLSAQNGTEKTVQTGSQRKYAPELIALMADWRYLDQPDLGGPLDYLVVNPPYFPVGASGKVKEARHQARHETLGHLGDLFQAAKRLLAPGARLSLTWPRSRLTDLTKISVKYDFTALRFEFPPRPGLDLILAEFKS